MPAVEHAEEALVLHDSFPDQSFLVARAGFAQIYSGIYPLICHLPIEHNLGVARTLEFLEDDIIHPTACFNQCRGNDGEGTAIFKVTRRAKELTGYLHGPGIETAAEGSSAVAMRNIERPPQPGEAIEEHHYVFSHFYKTPYMLHGNHRHPHVVVFIMVVARGKYLGGRRPYKVGYLFRTFVDEEGYQFNFGVISGKGIRHALYQYRLTRARRGHNQGSLTLSNRRGKVYDPHGKVRRTGDQIEFGIGVYDLSRIKRLGPLPRLARQPHHGAYFRELEIPASAGFHFPFYRYPVSQFVSLDERGRNERIGISFGDGRRELTQESEFLVSDEFHDPSDRGAWFTTSHEVGMVATAMLGSNDRNGAERQLERSSMR